MKKLTALILIIFICTGLFSCMPNLKKFAIRFADEKIDVGADDLKNEDYLAFMEKLDVFSSKLSADIYKKYGSNQNLCISPISVYMSLAIACENADGETREEILNALGVTYEELSAFTKYIYAERNKEYKYVNSVGKESTSASEQLSNSIWLADDLLYNKSYIDRLASNYNCDVFGVSFKDKTARDIINQYIEYKSNGIISSDISFGKNTPFSIISVYVLQEIWSDIGRGLPTTFDSYDFIDSDGSVSETQLLRGHYSNGQIYSTEKYSSFFIETEHGYKLHFIVPTEEYKLKDVFTFQTISEILALDDYGHIDDENGEIHFTRVLFPPFSTSFNADISSFLSEKYGIERLFDPELCDFSNLLSSPAHCEALIHKSQLNIKSSGIDCEVIYVDSNTPVSPDLPEYNEVYHEMIIGGAFGFVLTDESGTILYSGVINNLN